MAPRQALARVAVPRRSDVLARGPQLDREVIEIHGHLAAPPGDQRALELGRPIRVEVVIRVRVDDHGGLRPGRLEPLRVAAAGLRGRVGVAPAKRSSIGARVIRSAVYQSLQ